MDRTRARGRGATIPVHSGAIATNRIRVLHVIARLNLGGAAQHTSLLSGRRLSSERYESLLVHGRLAQGEQSMADLAEREGAQTRHLSQLGQPVSPVRDPLALAQLVRIARQFKPHIVHTHTAKAGFVGRAAALALRPRPAIVHTYHGHVLEGYFGPRKAALFRRLERGMARVSDCLIGVSDRTVDDLVRLGVAPRDRFRVIALGMDLDPFAGVDAAAGRKLRREVGIADDQVLLTFVGRIVPIKRVDVLLRGAAYAREAGARVQLAVIGDGAERPALRSLARELGIGDAVHFLGYRRDLPRIAAAADVAVLSSDNEGTPVSLIEAAAAATPAVATDVGGVAEVVAPDTGLLVPPGDERAFARALVDIAREPELRQAMGERARERALDRYSIDRLLRDIGELYEELVSARRS
jgi:glycosyltransferase involved in cell wall biosynthesis